MITDLSCVACEFLQQQLQGRIRTLVKLNLMSVGDFHEGIQPQIEIPNYFEFQCFGAFMSDQMSC